MLYLKRPNASKSAFALKWSDDGINYSLIGAVLFDIRKGAATVDYRLERKTSFPLDVSGNDALLIEATSGLANVTTVSGLESWLSTQGISSTDSHQVIGAGSTWDPNGSNPPFILGPGPMEIGLRVNGTFGDVGRGVRSAIVTRSGDQVRDSYYGIYNTGWPIEVSTGDAIREKVATDMSGGTPQDLEDYVDNHPGSELLRYVLETH